MQGIHAVIPVTCPVVLWHTATRPPGGKRNRKGRELGKQNKGKKERETDRKKEREMCRLTAGVSQKQSKSFNIRETWAEGEMEAHAGGGTNRSSAMPCGAMRSAKAALNWRLFSSVMEPSELSCANAHGAALPPKTMSSLSYTPSRMSCRHTRH